MNYSNLASDVVWQRAQVNLEPAGSFKAQRATAASQQFFEMYELRHTLPSNLSYRITANIAGIGHKV